MGQAKQRGSFAQRQSIAVERDKEIAKLRAAYERTRPTRKVSITSTAIMGLTAGLQTRRGLGCKS